MWGWVEFCFAVIGSLLGEPFRAKQLRKEGERAWPQSPCAARELQRRRRPGTGIKAAALEGGRRARDPLPAPSAPGLPLELSVPSCTWERDAGRMCLAAAASSPPRGPSLPSPLGSGCNEMCVRRGGDAPGTAAFVQGGQTPEAFLAAAASTRRAPRAGGGRRQRLEPSTFGSRCPVCGPALERLAGFWDRQGPRRGGGAWPQEGEAPCPEQCGFAPRLPRQWPRRILPLWPAHLHPGRGPPRRQGIVGAGWWWNFALPWSVLCLGN